jgi:hypothetical protein
MKVESANPRHALALQTFRNEVGRFSKPNKSKSVNRHTQQVNARTASKRGILI